MLRACPASLCRPPAELRLRSGNQRKKIDPAHHPGMGTGPISMQLSTTMLEIREVVIPSQGKAEFPLERKG